MNIRFERNKTSTVIVMYSLYLYFLGKSTYVKILKRNSEGKISLGKNISLT
jgi:hypothetical protein